jgi:ubiquinone biosynthesis O-methyltransferase
MILFLKHIFLYYRVPFVKNGIITFQKSDISNEATIISPLVGCNILDVGCGGGLLSESLARLGAKVTAIDPCEENIAVASLHAQKSKLPNLKYEVKTIEQLAQTSPKPVFDAITASEVIEHVESPEFFIQMCSDLLKVILSYF